MATGFGRNTSEACGSWRASLRQGFDCCRKLYEEQWTAWQQALGEHLSVEDAGSIPFRVGTAVLAVHELKDSWGGVIASLSFPWGEVHGDDDAGGYHLVWPRDAYEVPAPC